MKKKLMTIASLCLMASVANAHFGMSIASPDIVASPEMNSVNLTFSFSHPTAMLGMEMPRPRAVFMQHADEKIDLTNQLIEVDFLDKKAWGANVVLTEPGVYQVGLVPAPYWEPKEDIYIQHFTKVVIPNEWDDGSWAEPIGLPAEIIPLSRPFALYEGTPIRGKVVVKGQPVPNAPVEIEYYNEDGRVSDKESLYATYRVMTDAHGVFSFAPPWAGWWGFAALTKADETLTHEGKEKSVEWGAVLWTHIATPPEGR